MGRDDTLYQNENGASNDWDLWETFGSVGFSGHNASVSDEDQVFDDEDQFETFGDKRTLTDTTRRVSSKLLT